MDSLLNPSLGPFVQYMVIINLKRLTVWIGHMFTGWGPHPLSFMDIAFPTSFYLTQRRQTNLETMQITTVTTLATVVCTIVSASDLDQYDVVASGRELSGNIQYTPDLSPWDGIYEKFPLPDHTPAGVTWMKEDAWKPWDGVPLDPTKYETNQKSVLVLV